MKQTLRFLVLCVFALTVFVGANSAVADEPLSFTGPIMKVDALRGYIVVNEHVINTGSLPEPSIIESLEEDQWVCVEVREDQGGFMATDLRVINGPDDSLDS
jgi:hypothetical protein